MSWSCVEQLPIGCALNMTPFAPPAAAYPSSMFVVEPTFTVNTLDGSASDAATILGNPDPLDAIKTICSRIQVQPTVISYEDMEAYFELTQSIAQADGDHPKTTLDLPPTFFPSDRGIAIRASFNAPQTDVTPLWVGNTMTIPLRVLVPDLADGAAFFIFKMFAVMPSGHTVLVGMVLCRTCIQHPVSATALPVAYYPVNQRTPEKTTVLAFVSVACDPRLDSKRVSLLDLRVELLTFAEGRPASDRLDPRMLISTASPPPDLEITAKIQQHDLGEDFPLTLRPGETCVVPIELNIVKLSTGGLARPSSVTTRSRTLTPPPNMAPKPPGNAYSVVAMACFEIEGSDEEMAVPVLLQWQLPPPVAG